MAYLLQTIERHEGVVILATNPYRGIGVVFARLVGDVSGGLRLRGR